MNNSDRIPIEKVVTLDRPSRTVPSVDRPWDDPADRAHRQAVIKDDRSAHRVHHGLYEDMLN